MGSNCVLSRERYENKLVLQPASDHYNNLDVTFILHSEGKF